ncbi:MAG: bifunctional phosphopantothenoylcysteine decarboxylase/phosphopantothenate--cysteine ligase CoaBC [Bacteroidia bacterium]|nr:bifunctional phosphopantothenoylcysteine decarboxylase/phosphopantothenate--cysteine ligase CoaBC [Bacteroidia bacterium]
MKGKKILLGITGSIAAYKAALLTRLLVKSGAEVKIIMTQAAADFISPLTLSTLSKKPVLADISSDEEWNNHVELGLWADAMVIAPLSANTLAKMATGICDNLIMAVYLSAKCPVFFAPAMDLDMWQHPSTQNNIDTLKTYGNRLIDVSFGELASGLIGAGRMAEPEDIVLVLSDFFGDTKQLFGKHILITAGPTYEAIDPVRFIGNRSTGKMGLAIAKVCTAMGAEVTLVIGPHHLDIPEHIHEIRVESTKDMYNACHKYFEKSDFIVLSAAVADFRPDHVAEQKIKKTGESLELSLSKTEDIAASLGQIKRNNQIIVGFALETNNELENAKSKLKRKNFDYIVLNSMQDKGATFGHDTNKVTIIDKGNKIYDYELKSKDEVAKDIMDLILRNL